MRYLRIAALLLATVGTVTVVGQQHAGERLTSDDIRRGHVGTHSECNNNPNSDECLAARVHGGLHGSYSLDPGKERDVAEFARIVRSFETLSNEWACAMSWFGLYQVPNEKDTFDNIFKVLASGLKAKGQLYAAAVVKHFVKHVNTDEMKPYTCDGLTFRDASKWRYPAEVLLHMKEALSSWMLSHEADPTEVVDFTMTHTREIYGRWLLSRVMTIKRDAPNVANLPITIESVKPILQLIEGDKMEEVRCSAGPQLLLIFNNTANNDDMMATANRYLDECYTVGRLSKKPQNYARNLLGAGREKEARDLFDVAVQRGQLCDAKQRPSSHHRKDITAAPVWDIEAFSKETRQALLAIQDPLYEAITANRFQFSNDLLTFSMFVADGKWERTLLHGPTGLNKTMCNKWGDKICDGLAKLADVVTEANDAYSFACNETLIMNLWRVQPGAHTGYSVGPTNINLQIVMPIVAPNTAVVIQAGDEVVKARQGDIVVVDDSYENKVTVVDEEAEDEGRELATFTTNSGRKVLDPSFDISKGTVVFQMQVCHPDMHDKAMEVPAKKCAHLVPRELGYDSSAGSSSKMRADGADYGNEEL